MMLSPAALQVALAVALVIVTAYAAGRVHQRSRHGVEREVAYREGYDRASYALFHLAMRALPPGTAEPGAPHPTGDPAGTGTRLDRVRTS